MLTVMQQNVIWDYHMSLFGNSQVESWFHCVIDCSACRSAERLGSVCNYQIKMQLTSHWEQTMMSLNAPWKCRAGHRDPVPMARMFSLTSLSVKYYSEDHAMVGLGRKEARGRCGIDLGTEAFSPSVFKGNFPCFLHSFVLTSHTTWKCISNWVLNVACT